MNTLSIPVVVMASISFYVGFYHLLIYIRRRQYREDLTFSILCFTIVFYDAFCVGLYNASSVTEGAQWQRAQLIALAILVPAFFWFVSDYTRQKPGIVIYSSSIYYLLAVIVQLVDRSSLTWLVDQPSIKNINLPFELSVTYYEVAFGPFTTIQSFVGIIVSTYIFAMGIRYFKGGNKREAIPLLLATGFIYAAGFNDTMVGNGLYHFIYLMEYAYLGINVVMAYSLSNTVVEAAIAKDALRISEERFRSLVETTSDWVWEMDANGVYTYASPKVRELLGFEPEEIIGQTPFSLMPPDEANRVSAVFQNYVQSKKPLERLENINRSKDGRLVILETSGIPFFDESGRLSGYRGIDRNITERKRAEEALRESEQKFRAVVQNAQAIIFILDLDGVFLLSEGQALAKLGLVPGQVVGMSVYQIYQDNQSILDGITKSLAGELARFTSVENGVVFDTVCSPYYNLEGELTGVIGIAVDITERQQAEETLQMFQYTIDRARDAVQWLNREGGFEYVNEQACRSLGYTREELMRLHLWDIDPIYPRERWEKNWESYQEDRRGGSETVETLHRRKDGSVFPVEVLSNHLWFGDRELHVAVVRDITERKQAEEALRESEQKFRLFVEQSSVGVVFTDEEGIIIEWNPAQERLTGFSREESIGQPLWEIQPKMSSAHLQLPETSQRVKQMIQMVLQSGQADFLDRPMEIGLSRRDGTKIFVEQIAFSIKTNQGYRLGSIGRDITQIKQAEEELKVSEEKYRRLVEVSPIPMWINKDGLITYMNPAALQVLGATDLEQVVGKSALDFVHPDYHAVVNERITRITDEEIVAPLLEEKYIRLDGTVIDVEVTATPLFTSDTRAMQVLFQDITERKRAEVERENLIRELTEKNSELERFTYTVSHDLRSPLITIAGFLGYLEKDAVSGDMDRLRSDTQRIQNAVDKMDRLLNELLELSRIGRLMNPPSEVSFEEIVREALDNVHGQLDSRGVAVELAPNLPAVYGDRQRLVEVLQNLIDNAIKFMGDQPNPCIEIGQQGEETGKPIFFVRDNGIGISPEYHGRIFGLFDKLDAKTEGTGIGLALVKRIVEFHGGRIWVESEAGRGSTLFFTLPSMAEAMGGK